MNKKIKKIYKLNTVNLHNNKNSPVLPHSLWTNHLIYTAVYKRETDRYFLSTRKLTFTHLRLHIYTPANFKMILPVEIHLATILSGCDIHLAHSLSRLNHIKVTWSIQDGSNATSSSPSSTTTTTRVVEFRDVWTASTTADGKCDKCFNGRRNFGKLFASPV